MLLNSSELVRLTRRMPASPAADGLRYFQGGGRTQDWLIHVSEDRRCCSSRHPDHRRSPTADKFLHPQALDFQIFYSSCACLSRIPRTALDSHQLERFASNFTSPDSVHRPPRRGPLEPPGSASPGETPRTSEISWQSRSHGILSGLPVRKCSSALSCHRPSRCLSRLSPRSPLPAATGSVHMDATFFTRALPPTRGFAIDPLSTFATTHR